MDTCSKENDNCVRLTKSFKPAFLTWSHNTHNRILLTMGVKITVHTFRKSHHCLECFSIFVFGMKHCCKLEDFSENCERLFCEAGGYFQNGRRPHLYAYTIPRIKSTVSGPLLWYSKASFKLFQASFMHCEDALVAQPQKWLSKCIISKNAYHREKRGGRMHIQSRRISDN